MKKLMLTLLTLTITLAQAHAALLKSPKTGFEEQRRDLINLAKSRYKADPAAARTHLARDLKAKNSRIDALALEEAMKLELNTQDGKTFKVEEVASIIKDYTDSIPNLVKASKSKEDQGIARELVRAQAILPEFLSNLGSMDKNSEKSKLVTQVISLIPDALSFWGRRTKEDIDSGKTAEDVLKDLSSLLDTLQFTNEYMARNRSKEPNLELALEIGLAQNKGLANTEGKITDQKRLNEEIEKILGCARRG